MTTTTRHNPPRPAAPAYRPAAADPGAGVGAGNNRVGAGLHHAIRAAVPGLRRLRRNGGTIMSADNITLAAKRAYVRSQGQTRRHHCHWPGCQRQVPPAMWGCKEHWFKLPMHLRRAIWRTYQPGQEVDLTPSDDYLAAADAVERWIKDRICDEAKGR